MAQRPSARHASATRGLQMIEFTGVPVRMCRSVTMEEAVENWTTPRVYPSHGGTGTPIFRSEEAGLQMLEFHFSVFLTGCGIGQESLTGLKHDAKCPSPSTQQTWISLVEIGALFFGVVMCRI